MTSTTSCLRSHLTVARSDRLDASAPLPKVTSFRDLIPVIVAEVPSPQSHHCQYAPTPASSTSTSLIPSRPEETRLVMPDSFGVRGGWSSDIPIVTDSWKRALLKPPPNSFCVNVLPPEKRGNSHRYGFHVYAVKDDDASITTRKLSSRASIASVNEYDIWRKWEDCLLFQDSLELEYALAAREKRNRLAAGKGVKKNGVYIHSDEAASWESLPFGPDPNDIARDIHKYIPKLTKKGTLFRASQETVDRRYGDLQKMIQALFQDDLPMLIKELKATSTFTDFFGVWRRDVELARKAESSKQPTSGLPRGSISSSVLSAFPFSPNSLSAVTVSPSKGKAPAKEQVPSRTSAHSDCSSSEDSADRSRVSRLTNRPQDVRSLRSRGSSSESHSSSSLPSTPIAAPRQLPFTSRQPAIAPQEASVRFDHNPHVPGGERRSPVLQSLPEGRELSSPKFDPDTVQAQRQSGPTAGGTNPNATIYVPSKSFESLSGSSLRSSTHYSRASLQSMRSSNALMASAYLDELDVDYCLSGPTPEPPCRPRASVSSMASLMTNSSVDAVIPRGERSPASLRNSAQRAPSLRGQPKHESWSEDQCEEHDDILDAYFCDLIRPRALTPDGFPESPMLDEAMYRFSQAQSSSTTTVSSYSRYSDRRSSFATSISSGSTSSSSSPTTLSIKAMHEDNIVMLRLPRYITFDELRQRIYIKFMQADKATICESFAIAVLGPPSAEKAGEQRPRADSLSSLGSARAKGASLRFISSQDEWGDVVATHCGRMLLRIIGSRE